MNLLPTIVAKSDQLNADDLVGGPRTITVTDVKGSDSPEQPVWIHFEGDDGKPFKPCKTCRRLLVHCWGPEAADFIGRRMTLYTDPNVMFGGVKTGGIRISHVSHIEREMAVALMVTRGKRASHTVKPLKAEVVQRGGAAQTRTDIIPPSDLTLDQRADMLAERIAGAPSVIKLQAIKAAAAKLYADLAEENPERKADLEHAWNARFDELSPPEEEA
jgi:hypothetical protein